MVRLVNQRSNVLPVFSKVRTLVLLPVLGDVNVTHVSQKRNLNFKHTLQVQIQPCQMQMSPKLVTEHSASQAGTKMADGWEEVRNQPLIEKNIIDVRYMQFFGVIFSGKSTKGAAQKASKCDESRESIGISELPLIQLILYDKISCIWDSSEIK